ncbi:MAG: hypothetical protein OXG35_27415, partial [Acidobacteria bacterium]|nr:hypothetical protein [Acidobacteriota bacterium]
SAPSSDPPVLPELRRPIHCHDYVGIPTDIDEHPNQISSSGGRVGPTRLPDLPTSAQRDHLFRKQCDLEDNLIGDAPSGGLRRA